MSPLRRRPSRGLAARLLAGQSVVLVAGALTVGLVAAVVGPPIFHQHLLEAGHQQNSPELVHIEMAYRDASLIAVGVGLVISLIAAGIVTWVLARRLRRPLEQLTAAARDLSRGHYATRVPDVASGTELDTLASAFNTMAARLDSVEDTRRRMLSDLAHELRTPVATISAYHEGLHDGIAQLGPESRSVLTEQTQRLARLADDIDDVSTAEEGRLNLQLATTAVADLLWSAHENLRDQYADAGVNLVIDAGDAAGQSVRVDRSRIGQVLTNQRPAPHPPRGNSVPQRPAGRRAGDHQGRRRRGRHERRTARARFREVLSRRRRTHPRPHRHRNRIDHQPRHCRRTRWVHHGD